MPAKINTTLHYPYSDKYVYETVMEILNLDQEKVKDVTTGNGFIISAPKAIKDDLKDENGIFSSKYGQTLQDQKPFSNRYRCKCGYMTDKINNGQICPICHSQVKFVDDNFTYFGWITLKDPYHIIHPNLFMNIASLIGPSTFDEIIQPNDGKDEDGNEIFVERPKDEPYKKIGMMEFYNKFDEIIDYYVSKRPEKIDHYRLIKEHRDKVFIQSIPVYTIHLRGRRGRSVPARRGARRPREARRPSPRRARRTPRPARSRHRKRRAWRCTYRSGRCAPRRPPDRKSVV